MPQGLNYPFPQIPPLKRKLPLHTEAQLLRCVSEDTHPEFKKPWHESSMGQDAYSRGECPHVVPGSWNAFWGTLPSCVFMPITPLTRRMSHNYKILLSTRLRQEGWQPTREHGALWRSKCWQCIFLWGPRATSERPSKCQYPRGSAVNWLISLQKGISVMMDSVKEHPHY